MMLDNDRDKIRKQFAEYIKLHPQPEDGFDFKDYADIEFTHDEYGVPCVAYWVGAQSEALVSVEFLDEWFDNMDVPLEDGDIIDIWGLSVELVHHYPTRLLWAVAKWEEK